MTAKTTLSGEPPTQPSSAPSPRDGVDAVTGMHDDYWILSDEERAKGFVRPLYFAYHHTACGLTTTMASAIAETFARDPGFYLHTYCAHCRSHCAVNEFRWPHTDCVVGE